MSYKILESHIEFENNFPVCVMVLVEISKGDIRAIESNSKPSGGYYFILPETPLSEELLQTVAARGCTITEREAIPAEWIKKYS